MTPRVDALWVVCLCADWCGVCREWQAPFEALARSRPDAQFAWVDVEDEDEAMGDADIQTFPTLLLARGDQAAFLGAVPPTAHGVERLMDGLSLAQPFADDGAQALWDRLRPHVMKPNAS